MPILPLLETRSKGNEIMNAYGKSAMLAVMTTTLATFAATNSLTPEQRAEHKAAVVARVGGLLPRPGTPSGRIAIVNSQSIVAIDAFKTTYAKFANRVKGVDYWTVADSVGVETALSEKKKHYAQFAVFIVDSKSLPMSLIALEECWAIMNIRPLVDGCLDKALVMHRAKNEFARVLGIICGGASSQFPSAIMNEVSKPTDLNGCTDDLPVDVTAKIPRYLENHGVKGERITSYRKACEEGWAPAPTNDVQKAVWDKVHALPTEPIKITPETSKVND